jgi:hypothetical protein
LEEKKSRLAGFFEGLEQEDQASVVDSEAAAPTAKVSKGKR